MLKKTVGNWVDGDRFFDRHDDLLVLRDAVLDGTNLLLTGQRRMGKTSLVRESLRRLKAEDGISTLFVDLEDASGPADAVVKIVSEARRSASLSQRVAGWLGDSLGQIEAEASYEDIRFALRAQIHSGNWKDKGDAVFEAIASKSGNQVLIAIDELSLLINHVLKDDDYQMSREPVEQAREFMAWLRRNCQAHRGRITVIVLGSVGLQPILKQAGLSATMNVFLAYELRPWSPETASDCLAELAGSYGLDLSPEVRRAMCQPLRSCIPHHVQQYFDAVQRQLRLAGRTKASLKDAESADHNDMLGTRGRIELDHYEDRLKLILGPVGNPVALEVLARTARSGIWTSEDRLDYEHELRTFGEGGETTMPLVLEVLEHDGYLAKSEVGYQFESGLLEDWQRASLSLAPTQLPESEL